MTWGLGWSQGPQIGPRALEGKDASSGYSPLGWAVQGWGWKLSLESALCRPHVLPSRKRGPVASQGCLPHTH